MSFETLDNGRDQVRGNFRHETTLEIPRAGPWFVDVARPLEGDVVDGLDAVDQRLTQLTDGSERAFRPALRPRVANRESDHRVGNTPGTHCASDTPSFWRPNHQEEHVKLIRSLWTILRIHVQHVPRSLDRKQDRAAHHLALHLMEPEFERRHDTEVPTSATHAPEKIRVFLLVRTTELTIGRHHVDTREVIY